MSLNTVRCYADQVIQTWITNQVGVVRVAGSDSANPADLYTALADQLARLNSYPQVRGVVIAGAAGQFRSVSQGASLRPGLIENQFAEISRIAKPTVAAIDGSTDVSGLEVALACDVRICSQDARFPAGFCKPQGPDCNHAINVVLPRVVGPGWARLMAFSDRFITAERALRIGLVDEVVGADRLIERAVQVASRLPTEREAFNQRLN